MNEREYVEQLKREIAMLMDDRDSEVRQKNRLHYAIELQSDVLADALGKTTREGLSYMDMIADVKALRTALTPFAAIGAAVVAAQAARPNSSYGNEQAFTISGVTLAFADLVNAAAALPGVSAGTVSGDSARVGIAEIMEDAK